MSPSASINKLPIETLAEIFKVYAVAHPEVLDRRVVDLCLVGKHWKAVADGTPQLWTKINLKFPFGYRQLNAASKRIHASKLEEIDVSIDFRKPYWNGDGPHYEGIDTEATNEALWAKNISTVLRGTESRWRSIGVVSDTWLPLHRLIEAWNSTDLLSLRSIRMERASVIFGTRAVAFDPATLIRPITLFGRKAFLPKLRDLALSAVHVDWEDISVGFQNLRELRLNNLPLDIGPSSKVFAAMLSSSPRLECLDVSGFCPKRHTGSVPLAGMGSEIPIVHLPALKEFTFGWKDVGRGSSFLKMFQIGSSLERLTLKDTDSGLGCWRSEPARSRDWNQNSENIFKLLHSLAVAAPRDENDMPPTPFISMSGVKTLKIFWTEASSGAVTPFLGLLREVVDVELEDVDEGVLRAVVAAWGSRARADHRPMMVDLGWMWQAGIPSFAAGTTLDLEQAGIKVFVRETEG